MSDYVDVCSASNLALRIVFFWVVAGNRRSGCAVQPDVGNLPLLKALLASIREVRFK